VPVPFRGNTVPCPVRFLYRNKYWTGQASELEKGRQRLTISKASIAFCVEGGKVVLVAFATFREDRGSQRHGPVRFLRTQREDSFDRTLSFLCLLPPRLLPPYRGVPLFSHNHQHQQHPPWPLPLPRPIRRHPVHASVTPPWWQM